MKGKYFLLYQFYFFPFFFHVLKKKHEHIYA